MPPTIAPSITITVNGTDLEADVTQFVTKCVVEQSQEVADKITLTVANPREDTLGGGYSDVFAFVDSKVFQPGNEIVVSMGYDGEEQVVGAGVIQRFLPKFPDSGFPMLTIIAYDGSVLLMDGETSQEGMVWEDTSHTDVVYNLANDNSIIVDPDIAVTNSEKSTIKKPGMSDWELIQGLARLHGYYAKVRWDEAVNDWVLYWGEDIWAQETEYTFEYGSTLLSFFPEFGIRNAPSGVKLQYFDQDTKTWEAVEFKEEKKGEEVKFKGPEKLEEEILSSTSFRIASGGVAVEIVPGMNFETAEEAQQYAERWFRARKDQFIMGRGKTIGLEYVHVGHIHNITNIGVQLSGRYQFTTVRHIFDNQAGYTTEFFAHKVLD